MVHPVQPAVRASSCSRRDRPDAQCDSHGVDIGIDIGAPLRVERAREKQLGIPITNLSASSRLSSIRLRWLAHPHSSRALRDSRREGAPPFLDICTDGSHRSETPVFAVVERNA